MFISLFNVRYRTFIVASALLGALLLTLPSAVLAQQDKPRATPEKTKQYQSVTPEQIDKHISRLHDKLQVTAPQEAAWKDFSQVMRDNSKRMSALVEKWSQEKGKLTAVENMKAHAEMAEEHAQALKKLIPPFETLYSSMSAEQKKGADLEFNYEKGRGRHKGKNQ